MEKKYDVVALGELLIDFTENGVSPQGNPVLEANPGGAPCNVLAMLRKLGHRVAFIGKIGRDIFGAQLKAALKEVCIDTAGLVETEEYRTTLAFVHTLPGGNREFSFYRNPGADMMLKKEELNQELITSSKIFHFGTLSMTHEGCRNATVSAVELAKKSGAVISFDPNIREMLWENTEVLREQILYGLSVCDVLKIADNEIEWLTGCKNYHDGIDFIRNRYDISLILVSLGAQGSIACSGGCEVFAPAVLREDTIETTGAGDTFCGCILHYVLLNGLRVYDEAELKEMLGFANAAASLVTTKRGALRVMPTIDEIMANQ